MKKRLTYFFVGVLLLTLCPTFNSCSDDLRGRSGSAFYYQFDEKAYLDTTRDKVVVSFDADRLTEIERFLNADRRVRGIELFPDRGAEDIDYYLAVLTISDPNVRALRAEFSKKEGIRSVNPYYTLAGEDYSMLFGCEFMVKFKDNASQQRINEMNARFNVTVVKTTDLYVLLSVPAAADALAVANAYQESGLVVYSTPNFYAMASAFY